MKKFYLFFSFSLLIFHSLLAQSVDENSPIHSLLKTYVSQTNSLNEENSAQKVFDLYSEQYSGNTTYVNLSGGIIKREYTKSDIKKQINSILQDEEYGFVLKLDKILYSNQKENAGTISALLNFESYIDKKVAEKGTMLINFVAVSQNNKWKIIQNNMVRVSEEKDIGDCVCHIYSKGDTKFVTELYYPAGITYEHTFESFQFTTNGSSRIIKSPKQTYAWNRDNKILLEKKEVGIARTQKEAIELLIKDANKPPCTNIIFR